VLEEVVENVPILMKPLCDLYMEERDYAAAYACYRRVPQRIHRTMTAVFPTALGEAECLARLGEPDRARQKLEEALGLLEKEAKANPDDPAIRIAFGLIYARLDRREDAIREGERAVALQRASGDKNVGSTYEIGLAKIYSLVGEYEAALDTIDYLLSIPGDLSVAWLEGATWDPLRDHPRFAEILEKYGTEQSSPLQDDE
jgi:tetratricopeptide (TPR) repeat protein